jgi:hypothetical protein
MTRYNRQLRWAGVGFACFAMATWAVLSGDMTMYATNWLTTSFKALSGGLLGWLVSRYVIQLDLSKIPVDQRPLAALSQAILIGLFALAVATGA